MSSSIHAGLQADYLVDDVSNTSTHHTLQASPKQDFAFLQSRAVWVLTAISLYIFARALSDRRLPAGAKRLPRLPGLPWIGRFWGIPISGAEAAWHFGNFHKTYGPIYEWKTFGVTHVWVENDRVARDLLVHRGKKYGDRHELPAAVGVRDGSEILPLMGIGENFWRHKNFIHALNRAASAELFFEYPMIENTNTLKRLLDDPNRWSEHLVTHCARTIARIAWGDPKHGTKLLHIVPVLLKAVSPDGPIPNLLPFLQHLPAWMSPFKKAEARRKQEMQDAFYQAQQDVVTRYEAGTAENCWTKLWIENARGLEKSSLTQHEAAHAVGTNSLVAIVTIGSPLHSFFTAICHYPSWLPKLQAELDAVCGDRLPTMKDMPQLPILRAVVKETLRWRQPTPLGVPHITTEDDVYEGYFIPKGAMVHANHYLISREPSQYPEAEEWRPERWLDPSWPTYKEPLTEFPTLRNDAGFGYGPRACPGIELVLTECYTTIGAIASCFDIKRKEGRRGYENPVPWYETNPFVITMAKNFPCDIVPRSEEKARFVRNGCEAGSSVLVKKREEASDRWDIVRPDDESKPFEWFGLISPNTVTTTRKYAPGV